MSERQAAMQDLVYLLRCALNGEVPDPDRAAGMALGPLHRAARTHMVAAMADMALESAGVHDAAFRHSLSVSLRRTALMDADRAAVYGALDAAGIWYMPLKGSVLKDRYPKYGMREMSDCDILIDAARAKDVREIMASLGFSCDHLGAKKDDGYSRPPVSHFEMHRYLVEENVNARLYDYYRNVDRHLLPDGPCRRRFSDEDFYIYLIAHASVHEISGGGGLRSLADIWVFLRAAGPLDGEYLARELARAGLADLERRLRQLAEALFGEGAGAAADRDAMERLLASSAYGTVENQVERRTEALGGGGKGRLRFIMGRLFPNMTIIREVYPFFYRHRLLLPLLELYRLGKGLTVSWPKVRAEIRALMRRKR